MDKSRQLLVEKAMHESKSIAEKREKLVGFSTEYINESYGLVSKWKGLRDEEGTLVKAGMICEAEDGKEFQVSHDAIDWICGEQFPKVEKWMEGHTATLLESLEHSILNESAGTAEVAPFRDMILPIYRNALAQFKMTEVVGFLPISQPSTTIFVEKFYYAGKNNTITEPINSTKPRTTNTDTEYNSFVIRVRLTDANYNNITIGSSYVKAASGAGDNLAKIIYKEEGDLPGYAKLLVTLETGKTLPAVGTVYITGANADVTMTHVWNNEVGKRVILKSYGFYNTTSEGENLSEYLNVGLTTDSMKVDAQPYFIGFEINDMVIQDMFARHNLDAKKRLINAIQYQLASSVNMRLFNLLSSSAEIVSDFVYASADGRWSTERFIELRRKILYERNKIAHKTRRGVANILLTDLATASIIESEIGFVASDLATMERGAGIMKIGRWLGMDIYVNTFALNNFVILTYKGYEALTSGVFYCPFLGLSVSFANDFTNAMRKRVLFSERAAYATHPDGAYQFTTFFNINYSGSVLA